jgi:hypothetical protein
MNARDRLPLGVRRRLAVQHEFCINLSANGGEIGMTREELLVLADEESRALDVSTGGVPD